jgi:hypothetical protein
MKNIFAAFIFFISISCTENSNTISQNRPTNLDWLVGNWQRTNNQLGKQTFEHWIKESNGVYSGLGFTLQGLDTVFKENLRILKNDGHLFLEVTGVNENPTLFLFSNYSDSSFVCENEENEFPKKIEYSMSNNILTAIISDDSTLISFQFSKQ